MSDLPLTVEQAREKLLEKIRAQSLVAWRIDVVSECIADLIAAVHRDSEATPARELTDSVGRPFEPMPFDVAHCRQLADYAASAPSDEHTESAMFKEMILFLRKAADTIEAHAALHRQAFEAGWTAGHVAANERRVSDADLFSDWSKYQTKLQADTTAQHSASGPHSPVFSRVVPSVADSGLSLDLTPARERDLDRSNRETQERGSDGFRAWLACRWWPHH